MEQWSLPECDWRGVQEWGVVQSQDTSRPEKLASWAAFVPFLYPIFSSITIYSILFQLLYT